MAAPLTTVQSDGTQAMLNEQRVINGEYSRVTLSHSAKLLGCRWTLVSMHRHECHDVSGMVDFLKTRQPMDFDKSNLDTLNVLCELTMLVSDGSGVISREEWDSICEYPLLTYAYADKHECEEDTKMSHSSRPEEEKTELARTRL